MLFFIGALQKVKMDSLSELVSPANNSAVDYQIATNYGKREYGRLPFTMARCYNSIGKLSVSSSVVPFHVLSQYVLSACIFYTEQKITETKSRFWRSITDIYIVCMERQYEVDQKQKKHTRTTFTWSTIHQNARIWSHEFMWPTIP